MGFYALLMEILAPKVLTEFICPPLYEIEKTAISHRLVLTGQDHPIPNYLLKVIYLILQSTKYETPQVKESNRIF